MLQKELLSDLAKRTKEVIEQAEKLDQLPEEALNQRPDEGAWSALECIEHLNRYSRFYLPEIANRMEKGPRSKSSTFTSSWLGNYFAKTMLPRADKPNNMKTFRSMNPAGSELVKSVLRQFIDDQQHMLELLERASDRDLTRIKTGITISKWIKLRLGDTFRVVIYHNQRHLIQAMKAAQLDLATA